MVRRDHNTMWRLLALFGLLAQVVASFGHLHLDTGDSEAAASAGCGIEFKSPCPAPAHHDDDHECPICIAMNLVAAAVVPVPIEIAKPQLTIAARNFDNLAHIAVRARAQSFQARAPPIG